MSVKVKICGITSIGEARMLNQERPDYAGFVMFYEKSKRYNTVQNAWQVLRYLDNKIQKVAVVVSPNLEQIRMLEQMDFQVLQVHGELTEEVLASVRFPIWRAFNLTEAYGLETYAEEPKVAGYVLDAAVPGSGKPFDWKALQGFERGDKLLVLAGGLHSGNVGEAIEILHPDIVDVSSGVENETGKDAGLIKKFIGKVKEYE